MVTLVGLGLLSSSSTAEVEKQGSLVSSVSVLCGEFTFCFVLFSSTHGMWGGVVSLVVFTTGVWEDSVVSMSKLTIRFNKAALFDSVSFIVGRGSHVTLVKGGNTNGDALLGVLTNMHRPAHNEVSTPGRYIVTCLPRRLVARSKQAIFRRATRTFTRLRRVRTRVRHVGGRLRAHASCRDSDCVRLVRGISALDRGFCTVSTAGCRRSMRGTLLKLNFVHRSFRHRADSFDNK